MEINASQVGQNYATPKLDVDSNSVQAKRETLNELTSDLQQTKGLSVSAETNGQESENVSAEQIETVVSQLSKFVQTNSRQLSFSVDEGSNKQVVRVTDAESGQIIRQIPSEEVLKLSERLQDLQTELGTVIGVLFNKQV
ncbi:MAG: flagellar protein FlaG [Paraglaciecola sp.]|jgi:flagellar protein FlaG